MIESLTDRSPKIHTRARGADLAAWGRAVIASQIVTPYYNGGLSSITTVPHPNKDQRYFQGFSHLILQGTNLTLLMIEQPNGLRVLLADEQDNSEHIATVNGNGSVWICQPHVTQRIILSGRLEPAGPLRRIPNSELPSMLTDPISAAALFPPTQSITWQLKGHHKRSFGHSEAEIQIRSARGAMIVMRPLSVSAQA